MQDSRVLQPAWRVGQPWPGAGQAAGTACPDGAGFPQDPPPSSPPHPTQHQSPTGTRGTCGLKKEASEWVRTGETPSPAVLPRVLPPAHPAYGVEEPNLQRGKASQPARLAPNEPPRLCRAEHPRQCPPAQRSEDDALPTLPGAGAGAVLDRLGPPIAAWGQGEPAHRAGTTHRLLSPTFWCAAPWGLGSCGPLMLLPGRQLPETGHGSHLATAGPGRGQARCHTLKLGSPASLPRTWGQKVLLVRAAQAPR